MEKLFATKNICLQNIRNLDDEEVTYAYTEKLLERNVLIEFYGVSLVTDEEMHDETFISIHYLNGDRHYGYTLFGQVDDPILGPLPIFRLIVDAVEYIESCDDDNLAQDLKEISTSFSWTYKGSLNTRPFDLYDKAMEAIKETRKHISL